MSFANFVQAQLAEPLAIDGESITLVPAVAPYQLPPNDGGVVVLSDSMGKPSVVEIIKYASRDALTLLGVERGQEGTEAIAWEGNSYCYQSLTAGGFEAVKEIIDVHVQEQNPHPQYLDAGSAVSLAGPSVIYITQSAQFSISDFDAFTKYEVQASAGTASISGDTISYAAPNVEGPVTLTVYVGEYHRAIELDILPDRPAAPTITSPVATGVMDNPTISTGAFSLIGPNADTHAATDWEIWTGAGRTGTLVWSSLNNSASKLGITLPKDTLVIATDYYAAARHIGATFGAGEWAELAFRTADQFLPTVIGQPFGGGFYIGTLDGYVHIMADKSGEASLAWGGYGTAINTISTTDSKANTNTLVGSATVYEAARHCRNWRGGGFDDWDLPAKDVLNLAWLNVPPGGSATPAAFKTGGAQAFAAAYYWTSTENSSNNAWFQGFDDGYQYSSSKNNTRAVRPVRRVKI